MITAKLKILLFSLLFICNSIHPAIAQKMAKSPADSLAALGDSLRDAGNLKTAKEVYKKAVKIDENLVAAYAGLGKIAVEQQDWGGATNQFNNVLKHDKNNLEAHYFMGIADREKGKFKALILRKLDWDHSKKHFERVLQTDSLFRDVLLQYALLKRYQKKYTEAIELGQSQIRLHPEDDRSELELYRLYGYLIRHKNKDDVLRWLKQRQWNYVHFFIAEILRRTGEMESADSVLQELLQTTSFHQQPIYLALTKINYKENNPKQAENYYWKAVDSIQNRLDANFIFEELKYIVHKEELEEYKTYHTAAEWKSFFRKFWMQRDPTPAAAINIRLQEHYRRFSYAEKYYEYDGFKTWFNNPDKQHYLEFPVSYSLNHEFNDKGLIFIRQGEPDSRAVTVGESVPANESWHYYKTQVSPEMIFHFTKSNAAGNNWRFTPFLTNPEVIYDRVTWGSIYHRMLRASPLELLPIQNEMAKQSKKAVLSGLTTDRHSWGDSLKALYVPFDIAAFRGKQNKTRIELYYGIPISPFQAELEEDSAAISFESGISVCDTNWQSVFSKREEISHSPSDSLPTHWVDGFQFSVPADTYHVAFYTQPKKENLLAGYKFERRIPDYSQTNLTLSDILLATDIQPGESDDKNKSRGLNITVNPAGIFSLNHPVFIYFEIYGLTQDSNDQTRFSIEYTLTLEHQKKGVLKKLFGFLSKGNQSSISLKSDREGNQEQSNEYLSIDVSKLQQGEYQLSIQVEDKQSSDTAVQKVNLTLTELD